MNNDKLIKKFLIEQTDKRGLEQTADCPSEIELWDYLEGRFSESERRDIESHIASCAFCLEQLDLAQKAKNHPKSSFTTTNRFGLKARKKKRLLDIFKKWGWLSAMVISFLLSFFFHRYFLQFLVLAVIFGVKWIFQTGSTKTLIMIYQTWRKREKKDAERFDRNLHSLP